MKLSNNFLAIFVLAFLITSMTANLIIYKQFNDTEEISFFSGYATNVTFGEVNLSVERAISITLTNETINFGSCAINHTKGYSLIDSNSSNTSFDNFLCENGTFPDYLVLKNIGNVDAYILVEINTDPEDFFNDFNSWFAFATKNYSTTNFCSGTLQEEYKNFTAANISSTACSKLTNGNSFNLSMRAFVSSSATGGGNLAIVFTGSEAN